MKCKKSVSVALINMFFPLQILQNECLEEAAKYFMTDCVELDCTPLFECDTTLFGLSGTC